MTSQPTLQPGSIVKCRDREWVLLPSDDPDIILLRPLTGAIDSVAAIHKQLSNQIGFTLPFERVNSATFPLPTGDDVADANSAHLLWQAARLTLREGAAPFRSLGRISIRPRVYQFVPMLMALKLDPIRLLIADDVGVGKTIEALLVAKELLERGEIKRLCVLCPPYLCQQWQIEMGKFDLEPVIIRSGTINQLDRRKHSSESIYRHYPIQIASIDFVKTDRNKHAFLQDCPELVIIDEAHGAAAADPSNPAQHQRNALLTDLSNHDGRHLILLTATPHSGIEGAFRSLLSIVDLRFGQWRMSELDDSQRRELALHFVQRTRRDIETDWEGQHCFPKRESSDETYALSPEYKDLFDKTYAYCTELIRGGEGLSKRLQRVRYWTAIALLRCVMSSPAAAVAALDTRQKALPPSDDESDFVPPKFESTDEQPDDSQPTPTIEEAQSNMPESERRRLRELGKLAASIQGTNGDRKLTGCAALVRSVLSQGYHPIVWCRYIATADYVAEHLERLLGSDFEGLRVASITSSTGDEDERRAKLAEFEADKPRVLVATDCLSEGINLQELFNAAIHYDLPWNPNRLEQREGRVDRYGQTSKVVKAIRYFSPDSAVDGVVIRVLLDKAREIHRTLGTHVPVPEESESVTAAVLNAVFLGKRAKKDDSQIELELESSPDVHRFHKRWDEEAAREKINRTRFAQRALKPDEVRRELKATDAVLGDPDAVRMFVLNAAERIGLPIAPDRKPDVYRIAIGPQTRADLPEPIRFALPEKKSQTWLVSFVSPTPEGAEYLGRNHRFVAALAQFLMEEAITKSGNARAARCGAIPTKSVSVPTVLMLLRVRYLLQQPEGATLLAEEVQVLGRSGMTGGEGVWLPTAESLRLLSEAQADAIIPLDEKKAMVAAALGLWPDLQDDLKAQIESRAGELRESHKRIRSAVHMRVRNLTVRPQLPPDLLGLLVLLPLG